jgi:hypothetical protein
MSVLRCPDCASEFSSVNWLDFAKHLGTHGLGYIPPGPRYPLGIIVPGARLSPQTHRRLT